MTGRLPVVWRLTIAFAVATAIVLVAGGLLLRQSLYRELDRSVSKSLQVRAETVAARRHLEAAEALDRRIRSLNIAQFCTAQRFSIAARSLITLVGPIQATPSLWWMWPQTWARGARRWGVAPGGLRWEWPRLSAAGPGTGRGPRNRPLWRFRGPRWPAHRTLPPLMARYWRVDSHMSLLCHLALGCR